MVANTKTIKAGNITTVVSIIVNIFLCLTKTIIGFMTGSTVLIADGIHSLADLITDVFTYTILRVAHSGPDESHPYGHGKFETFGTMFLALFLAIVAVAIGYEAIQDINNPENRAKLSYIALVAAAISVIANEGLYHFCTYKGKQVNSPIILANAWHHRTDSLSSIAAFIGIGLNMAGFLIADAIAALAVTAFLLKISYKIGRGAFDELVDASVDEKTLYAIKSSITGNSGVLSFHQLRTRSIGGQLFIDVHADVTSNISVSEGHAIAHSIEESLHRDIKHVADTTVHIDPINAKQSSLSPTLYRENIEPLIDKIIKSHLPNAVIVSIYLHILNEGDYADIVIKNININNKQLKALKNELEGEKTPFKSITFNVEAE